MRIDNSTHDDHSMRGNNNVNMSGASGISGHININSRINTRSAVGLAGPEVSNTAGGAVRIYYSNDEMRRVDILSKGVGGGEQKFTGSVPYMTIPADETVSVPPVKITYVSVYLESSSGDCKKVIVENYKVPENKSFVVTPDAINEEEV